MRISSITITTIDYIVSKLENRQKAKLQRDKILKLVQIENVGQRTIAKAHISQFTDFEDAVQNYCAIEAGHTITITRNTKDFKESSLSILTPKEYLAKLESSQ